MTLANSAVLVSLHIKQWSARKLDRKASKEVCDAHEAHSSAGNFNKQLIRKMDLKPIQRVVNSARNYHYENTLAWDHDGADMLPSRHYITYMSKMADYQAEFQKEVDNFIKTYPELLTSVMNDLSSLYNSEDYPSQEKLRHKFTMNIRVTPIPESGDFRVDLPEKERQKLQEELDQRLSDANQAAEKDLYMRLYTTLAKAVVVLKTPDKIFRNSLILNIIELTNKIPAMNFNNSTELEQHARDLSVISKNIEIDKLREEDAIYRRTVANDLENELQDIEQTYLSKWSDLS